MLVGFGKIQNSTGFKVESWVSLLIFKHTMGLKKKNFIILPLGQVFKIYKKEKHTRKNSFASLIKPCMYRWTANS